LRRATASASGEMSLATTVAPGRSWATATATQPHPVHTSAIRQRRVAVGEELERRFDDQLGGRPWNQDVRVDFELQPQNSRCPTM
jgi:hypothetical protein